MPVSGKGRKRGETRGDNRRGDEIQEIRGDNKRLQEKRLDMRGEQEKNMRQEEIIRGDEKIKRIMRK